MVKKCLPLFLLSLLLLQPAMAANRVLMFAIDTNDPELNGSYAVQLSDRNEQKFTFPINNHYFEAIVVKSFGNKVKVRLKTYTDTDSAESLIKNYLVELSPGERTRVWLRGPRLKRAPFFMILQEK